MRVSPDYLTPLLDALDRVQSTQQDALQRLGTGRRLQRVSDDPAACAELAQVETQSAAVDQFSSNVTSLRGMLQTSDSALNDTVLLLQREIVLGTQAANGTLSDADRSAIAGEVSGIRDQLLGLANTTYQGHYVFAGTAVTQPAFVTDSTGVKYQGSKSVETIAVSEGQRIQLTYPGDKIFDVVGASVFAATQQMLDALTNGTGISDAVTSVRSAFDNVRMQRVSLDTAMTQLDHAEQQLGNQNVDLQARIQDLAGADLAQTMTTIANADTARQALLETATQINRFNLFDFLK